MDPRREIFVKWKESEAIDRLKFVDFEKWLTLPWPKVVPPAESAIQPMEAIPSDGATQPQA